MTQQIMTFFSSKDRIPFFNNSFNMYQFRFPGCCASYVGKTKRTLHERCVEHSWCDKGCAVRTHIDECQGIKHIKNLMLMNPWLDTTITTSDHCDINNNIKNNVPIIDFHENWNALLHKEGIKMKEMKPMLNNDLKASTQLTFQRRINVVDERWNNVYPASKMN